MQLQLRKLPFKIMDYTSCDPEFPPEDLMAKQSPLATGWQSERFCSYPQTIIIKLFNSQRIFKIQLLLHHYKIATKLELFTSSDNVDYTRLGYVTLGDNSINEFKARELKTIHLDIQTQYIKIDFYKCFVNPLNLYNQVGLVALNVLGSEIVNQMDKVMDDFMTSNAVVRGIIGKSIHNGNLPFNEDLRFLDHDNFILHALTSVSKRKKMAVNDENYILAKNLKSLQEYISQNGVKLTSLESQKRFYIDREEFDQAQSYQNEIQSLKESITKNILMNGFELSKDGLLDLKTNGFYIKSKEIVESQPSVLKNIVNHDNIPVGTNKIPVVSRSATPNDSRPNTAGSRDPTTPNELDALEMQRLALPIKIFGQRPISCLVSPYFGLRQQGINRVNEILIDSGEHSDDDICKATFQVIQLMVTDARERSNAMTCDLYKNLLDFCKSKHVKDSIVVSSISETISSFLNKTEDMNPRTREKSMDIVLYMGELYHTTPGTILPFICKPFTNKIQSVPWKHIKARLEIIAQFLTLYGIVDGKNPTQSGWSSTLLIQFIKPFCNHTNPTIRDLSVGLLAQLAVLIGPYALLENVNDIPSNQTELLKAKISAISNTDLSKPVKEVQEPKQRKESPKSEPINFQEFEKICLFCNKKDSTYNPDKLDQHYWESCPALVPCKECQTLVEVIDLQSHLLNDCQSHSKYESCRTCKLSILKSQMSLHSKNCKHLKHLDHVQCPYCHLEVQDVNALSNHLILKKGCGENPRKMSGGTKLFSFI